MWQPRLRSADSSLVSFLMIRNACGPRWTSGSTLHWTGRFLHVSGMHKWTLSGLRAGWWRLFCTCPAPGSVLCPCPSHFLIGELHLPPLVGSAKGRHWDPVNPLAVPNCGCSPPPTPPSGNHVTFSTCCFRPRGCRAFLVLSQHSALGLVCAVMSRRTTLRAVAILISHCWCKPQFVPSVVDGHLACL